MTGNKLPLNWNSRGAVLEMVRIGEQPCFLMAEKMAFVKTISFAYLRLRNLCSHWVGH
jgi:hypothetical protein